jgi:GntR family transcriptional regulator, transcriptional repressor for pyruvate dehydrogenase complex
VVRLQKIARRTLSDEVFDQLSAEIVQGRMQPGIALPPERELVGMLGVNRGAIREALKRLAQAGLVEIQQGGGTTVLDYRRSGGLDLLGRLLFHADGSVDLRVARSLMEMRAALAPDIARLCARRGGRPAGQRLRAIATRMGEAGEDLDGLQVLSLEFWDELTRGAGNIAYELAFNTLRETYERIRGALVQVMADEVRDLAAYASIADAVTRGDELAARHVAAALVEHGTHRVMNLIAALERDDAPKEEAS